MRSAVKQRGTDGARFTMEMPTRVTPYPATHAHQASIRRDVDRAATAPARTPVCREPQSQRHPAAGIQGTAPSGTIRRATAQTGKQADHRGTTAIPLPILTIAAATSAKKTACACLQLIAATRFLEVVHTIAF